MTTVALPDDAVLEVLRQVADAYRDDPDNVCEVLGELAEAHKACDDHDAIQEHGLSVLDGELYGCQRTALRELIDTPVLLHVTDVQIRVSARGA